MKQTYSEKLKHGRWQQRRLEIMSRDGFRCTRCSSEERLQVHHKAYYKRREVWQYKDEDLTTLCDMCHHAEHFKKPIAPAKVWEGIIDNHPPPETETKKRILRLQALLLKPVGQILETEILTKIIQLTHKERTHG